jgi:hypothetical protein
MLVAGGYVVLDLSDAGRRDVLLASETARHAAHSLERCAARALASGDVSTGDAAPGIEIRCVLDAGKPLVQWVLGRWATSLSLSPARALALAQGTRRAAQEVEERARWWELREPLALMK